MTAHAQPKDPSATKDQPKTPKAGDAPKAPAPNPDESADADDADDADDEGEDEPVDSKVGGPAEPDAAPAPEEPTAAEKPAAATAEGQGELTILVGDDKATIHIDGQLVGQGSFRGAVAPGRHQIRVEREGYETFEGWVDVAAGEARSESITLRQSVATPEPVQGKADAAQRNGIYGAFSILGAFEPGGSQHTLDRSCDSIGATSCDAGSVTGAGLTAHVGWFFDPVGLEIMVLGSADVVEPTATFDGTQGSDINPIVATPAREENFTIGRFGGGTALRGRYTYSMRPLAFSVAVGPGFVYRLFAYRRSTEAAGGYMGEVAESGANYVSPMLSMELSAQYYLSRSFGLSLGLVSWLEHAGDEAVTEPDTNETLVSSSGPPLQQATPSYQLANGLQWFIGPSVGMVFGP